MSFNNLPKIDHSAEKESLSKNALREHFQEENGFIAREDHPELTFLEFKLTDEYLGSPAHQQHLKDAIDKAEIAYHHLLP